MNKQKNKTVSFVLIMIAAASIASLVTPSLGIDVQAEKDEVENESNYNDNQHESNYNDNYANNEYAKYYDPKDKDKDVKIEVIKCDNSITNINAAEAANSQNQEPANVGVVDLFGVQGAQEEAAAASATNGMNGMDGDKLAQLSIDKNTIVVCWSDNVNTQDNNNNTPFTGNQQNEQSANSPDSFQDQEN
jgi:hypothetical protein